MATLSIKSSKHGGKSVSYTKDVKSHSEEFERCLELSGINCNAENAREEFKIVWDRFGVETGEDIQTYNLIQAFSKDEFNPDNPDDIRRVNEIGHALARRLYPDRQAIIATQADNEGRNLHNHIVVNNVNPIDGSRLSGERIRWINLSKDHDELLKEFGAHVIERDNEKAFDKQTIKEMKLREAGKYVWKDDLKSRIETCLEDKTIKSNDDFIEKMNEDYKVDVRVRKNGNISYYFTDEEEKQRKIRAGKLGLKYSKEGVNYAITTNQKGIEPIPEPKLPRLTEAFPINGEPEPSDTIPNPPHREPEREPEYADQIYYYFNHKPNEKRRVATKDNGKSTKDSESPEFTAGELEIIRELAKQIDEDNRNFAIRQSKLRSDRDAKRGKSKSRSYDEPEI